MEKKRNLWIIPTDKPSRLFNCFGKLEIGDYVTTRENLQVANQNIYITNDEEIKEGDYCISHLNIIDEGKIHNSQTIFNPKTKEHLILLQSCKKIILTTDTDLIQDGVQAIDDEFLIWFINNSSCEVVKIETFEVEDYIGFAGHTSYPTFYNEYKIIIPKEEPKQEKLTYTESARKEERISNCTMMKRKQETVEERELYWDLVDAKAEQNNTIDLDAYAKGVQDGVKWMQERMYSEKEVESLLHKYMQSQIPDWHGWSTTKWFEQFKKK